ncbi:MAG TPA: hypothetical protein VFF67_05115 [Thermoplasmata archaeon]|nr:hypothetical protein [Thermoplasmata archaeon]
MAWTLYEVASEKRAELDAALKDDVVSRQSQKLREAAAVGGPVGRVYVLIEGSPEGVARADAVLGPVGTKLPTADGERLFRQFKEEDDTASAGMGLFFTE